MMTFENALRRVACDLTQTDYLVVHSRLVTLIAPNVAMVTKVIYPHRFGRRGDGPAIAPLFQLFQGKL